MPINVQAILAQNVTLLYDSLDLGPSHLDRNSLRVIAGQNAAVMDTDEMIVAIQPQNNTIIQIGDRRIRATSQMGTTFASVPLWLIAHNLHSLVTQHHLVAYGFNFELVFALNESSTDWLNSRFIADRARLQEKLNGELTALLPRLQYTQNQIRYDLRMEPREADSLFAHLNVHFPGEALPPQNVLERQYREEYNRFLETMERLMENRA